MAGRLSEYSKKVLDYFRNPRNVGRIENPDGEAFISDPTRGVTMELFIKVEHGQITDARFKATGCGATIATTSVITELLTGRKIDQAKSITADDLAHALELSPKKHYVAELGQELIAAAVDSYYRNHP